MSRTARIERKTAETRIRLSLDLDGTGRTRIATGVGFFDHMLTLLCRHALIDAEIEAEGDLQVDAHHTVEDVGICLGKALAEAAGDKKGIVRYGSLCLPMDEALARIALDLSGRPFFVFRGAVPNEKIGEFDACLAWEFLRAVCSHGGLTLHVDLLAGSDPHHCLEAVFKGTGRALRAALSTDPRESGVPSSKGVL